jgi:hypothetical protein
MGDMQRKIAKIKTCFVSAPPGIRLDVLRDSLLARKIRPLLPLDLSIGTDWSSELQRELLEADLVIGILPSGPQRASTVFFELGLASALKRRILVIAPPGSEPPPVALQRLVLNTTTENRQAIDFALDQLISAPADSAAVEKRKPFQSSVLGSGTDALLKRFDYSLYVNKPSAFEELIAEAIRTSGADLVVQSPQPGKGPDLAIWSDVLEPFVGNPLLVEVKLKLETRAAATTTFAEILHFMEASSSRWSLLIYGQGPRPETDFWSHCPPNILLMSGRTLLENLRAQTFAEIIRDLRNQRVHSVRP